MIVHDLDHLLAGRDAPQNLGADRLLAYRGDELLDHRQRDIGLAENGKLTPSLLKALRTAR